MATCEKHGYWEDTEANYCPHCMEEKIQKLEDAVQYAMHIIESYEMDIRDSEWTGVDLVEKGFCQGRIYKNAILNILRKTK